VSDATGCPVGRAPQAQGAEGIKRNILSHSKMHCLTCQGLRPPAVRGVSDATGCPVGRAPQAQGAERINRNILSHSKMHCLTCQGLRPPAVRGVHGCCDSSLGPPLTPLYPSTPRFWPPSEAKVINLYNALQWLAAAAHVHSPYWLSATATLTFAPPGSNLNEVIPPLRELGPGPALVGNWGAGD